MMSSQYRFDFDWRAIAGALAVVALGCAIGNTAHATSGGVDTLPTVLELPLSTHGQVGIDLYDSVSDPAQPKPQQLSTTTAPPKVVIPGSMAIGTTSLPQVALDSAGAVRPGSSTVALTCGSAQAGGEGSIRYNYAAHQLEYCDGSAWSGNFFMRKLQMITPALLLQVSLTGSGSSSVKATVWKTYTLPSIPANATKVLLQYIFEDVDPDSVDNSYLESRATASDAIYYIAALRCSGGKDSCGGAGQVMVPFNTADGTIQITQDPFYWQASATTYSIWAVGYE